MINEFFVNYNRKINYKTFIQKINNQWVLYTITWLFYKI